MWSGRVDRSLEFRLDKKPSARYLLLAPRQYDPRRRYELWVTFHGVAGTAEDGLCEWYHYADQRNAFLLAPHGAGQIHNPTRSFMSYNHPEFDPQDAIDAIDEVAERYNVDAGHLVLFGTSEGAQLAWQVASRIPDRVRFLSMIGDDWIAPDQAPPQVDVPALKIAARHIAVFYGRGLADVAFDPHRYDATVNCLKSLGFPLRAMKWPGLGHDDRSYRTEVLRFLDVSRGQPDRVTGRWQIDLRGPWKVQFVKRLNRFEGCYDDQGLSPIARTAAQPSSDDSSWQTVELPSARATWRGKWGADYNGELVFRKRVWIPDAIVGNRLAVNLGKIEALDDVFFNGRLIGATTAWEPYWEYCPRQYVIPRNLPKRGWNLLTVRIWDRCGGGSIAEGGPGDFYLFQDFGGNKFDRTAPREIAEELARNDD